MTRFGGGPLREALIQEAAVSLGVAGRRLRLALEALRRSDANNGSARNYPARQRLVERAAEACWEYLVQREVLGFGREDAQQVRKQYGVPDEVWALLGVRRR